MFRLCSAAILSAALLLAGSAFAQTKQPPLRTGVDGTFAPHAMPKLGGGTEGFQIDLFTEVARRMGREITFDSVSFSTLDPGHALGPLRLHRSADHGHQGARRADALHRRLPVDRVPVRHQERLEADHGLGGPQGPGRLGQQGHALRDALQEDGRAAWFTVQAYDTQPDATQAVLSGRAYATLGGNTTIVYAASKNPQFVADLELTDTRAHWAAPFPKQSVALRNQMQDVLDCMKKDGTIAKLSEKWFGKTPAPIRSSA
jgi:polar amino acid transport system substrate-binding protein